MIPGTNTGPLNPGLSRWVEQLHMSAVTAIVGKQLLKRNPNPFRIFGAINNGVSAMQMTTNGVNIDAMVNNQLQQVSTIATAPHVQQAAALQQPVVQTNEVSNTDILNAINSMDARITDIEARQT